MEVTFNARSGIKLSGKIWRNDQNHVCGKSTLNILALHGFMDNSASFDFLAPLILQKIPNAVIVGIDAAGHGQSEHRPGSFYTVTEDVADLAFVIKQLEWTKFCIMGHSRGGNLGLMLAAIMPVETTKLLLLDILGHSVLQDGKTVDNLKKFVNESDKQLNRKPRIYPFLNNTVERIMEANPFLEIHSAQALTNRGTKSVEGKEVIVRFEWRHSAKFSVEIAGNFNGWRPTPLKKTAISEPIPTQSRNSGYYEQISRIWAIEIPVVSGTIQYKFIVDGEWVVDKTKPVVCDDSGHFNNSEFVGFEFSHDLAIGMNFASPVKYTEGQLKDFFNKVTCPVLVLWAEAAKKTWKFDEIETFARVKWFPDSKKVEIRRVTGGHHVHMDDPASIIKHVIEFLDK